jgi:type I restriction enzyme M protein
MLKPSGRAAIVLPQGKFNNSSLAFIREWILKKGRLLAVVGLHPNTFKPHTGTKTSVLFVQKYTKNELDQIATVHDQVAVACPDYEAEIKKLLQAHESLSDGPDEAVPEPIADLIVERLSEPEPEPEEVVNGASQDENGELEDEKSTSVEDAAAIAEEKLSEIKAALVKAKQKLMDIESDSEALAQKHEQEVAVITNTWKGTKSELNAHLKPIKAKFKVVLAELKGAQKDTQKAIKAEIKSLEKQIPQAEFELRLLSNRGKLTLILEDSELIGTLKERWIAAEVAKRLDYPIFMAVSERGGKNNSGDYAYVVEQGSLVEFPDGHPQEGQLVVDQDLVNYDLLPADLADAEDIADEKRCVAEAFIRFAQMQKLGFWESN